VLTVLCGALPAVAAGTLALDALDGAGGCGAIRVVPMGAAAAAETAMDSAWDELADAGDGRGRGADSGEDSEELFEDLG